MEMKHNETGSSTAGSGSQVEDFAGPSSSLDAAAIRALLADECKLRLHATTFFDAFADTDDLSLDELGRCLQVCELGIGKFTARQIKHYFSSFDSNRDNVLSCSERLNLYRHLLLVKLDELEGQELGRKLFITRREGKPQESYKLLETIGAGSFGTVRKVKCLRSQAFRVMKVINVRKDGKSCKQPTYMAEIDKLRTLDHPSVLRLFEFFVQPESIYLITDHLPGGNLMAAVERAHVSAEILEEHWVCDVFRQVCEGAAYCHAKGVMHKDLKLENVVLCTFEPPEAVIIDVGLAELFPAEDHSSDRAGTISTMAPEVIRGRFTAKCDVWSLGCCLYAMLNCKPWRAPGKVPGKTFCDFYPFSPPRGKSAQELHAYTERQKFGPDMARLGGGRMAKELIQELLSFEDAERPAMQMVLRHPWLCRSKEMSQVLSAAQLESLLQFHRINPLARTVLLDLASQLPLQRISDLGCLFESLDDDGNGMLDECELSHALLKAGLGTDSAKQAALHLVQGARGGALEFSRFVAALIPAYDELLSGSDLLRSFQRLDADGDGCVSCTELQQLLERGSEEEDASRASGVARRAFDAISSEGRMKVTFESFKRHLGDFVA